MIHVKEKTKDFLTQADPMESSINSNVFVWTLYWPWPKVQDMVHCVTIFNLELRPKNQQSAVQEESNFIAL